MYRLRGISHAYCRRLQRMSVIVVAIPTENWLTRCLRVHRSCLWKVAGASDSRPHPSTLISIVKCVGWLDVVRIS